MRQRNKLFSVFMSFVLAFTLFGVPAYADETDEPAAEQTMPEADSGVDSGGSTVQQGDEQPSSDEQEQDAASAGDVEKSAEGQASDSDGEERNDEDRSSVDGQKKEETAKDSDALKAPASDVVGFVYVDESVIAVGQEQNIAIGLVDEEAVISHARLDLVSLDDETTVEVDAATVAGDTMLFKKTFEDQGDAAAYQLVGVRYELDDKAYYADLTATDDEMSYTFDVVSQSVADAMKDSSEVAEDGEVSAFTIEGDGELVAKESVEAAIQTADTEGVQNVEAGASVVDQEMLDLGITGEASIDSENEAASDEASGDFFAGAFGAKSAWAAASSAREDYLIVALDPGHGGSDGGASGYGVVEKNVNLSIAQYCYNELSTYTGVTPYMTRNGDEYVGLQGRVNRAVAVGADVFVSIHCNSGGGTGAEVWVPNGSSYNYGTHVEGSDLGNKILAKLTALGLADRGIKVRNSERVDGEGPFYYPDGSIQDYYTVIEASREEGIPGIIVEHAFVDNASDASKLNSDSFRQQLGVADATGIAQKYSLVKDAVAKSQSLVKAKGHIGNAGWLSDVYDQKVIGTTGKAKGLQAFQASLQNAAASAGGIEYRSYVGNAWQDWVGNGATSGTTGQGVALQAIQMKLTGSAANNYDVYYRAHVANVGWLGWASNGQSAGSIGYGYDAEAIEIVIVAKGAAAPGDTTTPLKTKTETISYQAHVANTGWQNAVTSGAAAGTTGRGLSIEALKVSIANQTTNGSVEYNVHCANIGWQGWKSNGALGGTTGQARQTEAIQIKLTGELTNKYDVYYRVHSAQLGWLDWAKNGETAGTEGYGYSMQAIQVKLVKKGDASPGSTANPNRKALIGYDAHVTNIGWQSKVLDGATAGTSGRSLAIEALEISLPTQAYAGGITYRAHCAGIGWQSWRSDGSMAGTTGQARQVEAIEIKLTGEMASHYDVYYRVHSRNFGWLGWAKNGESAGTAGYAYRMEAIQIVLVDKGGSAPGATDEAFKDATASDIMGATQASSAQMANYYNASGRSYPASIYASKGAGSIEQFCELVIEEANAEGVRAEVLFCQAMKETGWLGFGGDVKAQQCNFGGLGATGGGAGGATFSDVRTGLRAQAQHLKAYASTAALNNPCVDPRFGLVTRGIAPKLEDLNGRWAVPGNNYGQDILNMINTLLRY